MYRLFVFVIFSIIIPYLYAVPKNGIRAVWVTTAYSLDWPHDMKQSKKELIDMLDSFKDLNINTVMFQTRIRGDVVYRSNIEPMNYLFKDFDYDPLDFVIKECHKRGMECHAWIVCMPLGSVKYMKRYGRESFVAKNKNLAMLYKGNWYMNPDSPGTVSYLVGLVGEIVDNYDVDGIHLDYIRYPDEYKSFPNNVVDCSKKAACRRDRITTLVTSIYNKVKNLKPWVKLSCATIGKYTDTGRYSSRGWEAFNGVGQDVEKWINLGVVDMVYPMIYFKGNDFYPFLADWKERFGSNFIAPVIGIYRLDNTEGGWSLGEIESQLNFCKKLGFLNIGMYRAGYLKNNTKSVYPLVLNKYFNNTLIPGYKTLMGKTVKPDRPKLNHVKVKEDGFVATWNITSSDKDSQCHYVLYGSNRFPVDIDNPRNIIDENIVGNHYEYTCTYSSERYLYYALTAIDRYGNESEPCYINTDSIDVRYGVYISNGSYILK